MGDRKVKAKEFDRYLSENSKFPNVVYMHPSVWNGYWSIYKRPIIVSKIFRFVGRKLHSRKIYWIGFPLYWVDGMKKYFPDIEPEEIGEE